MVQTRNGIAPIVAPTECQRIAPIVPHDFDVRSKDVPVEAKAYYFALSPAESNQHEFCEIVDDIIKPNYNNVALWFIEKAIEDKIKKTQPDANAAAIASNVSNL